MVKSCQNIHGKLKRKQQLRTKKVPIPAKLKISEQRSKCAYDRLVVEGTPCKDRYLPI